MRHADWLDERVAEEALEAQAGGEDDDGRFEHRDRKSGGR